MIFNQTNLFESITPTQSSPPFIHKTKTLSTSSTVKYTVDKQWAQMIFIRYCDNLNILFVEIKSSHISEICIILDPNLSLDLECIEAEMAVSIERKRTLYLWESAEPTFQTNSPPINSNLND